MQSSTLQGPVIASTVASGYLEMRTNTSDAFVMARMPLPAVLRPGNEKEVTMRVSVRARHDKEDTYEVQGNADRPPLSAMQDLSFIPIVR